MIIIYENGRLGNQLFQYAALKALCPDHSLLFFGFNSLRHLLYLPSPRTLFIGESKFLAPRIVKLIKWTISLLEACGMIGKIRESRSPSGYKINKKTGLVPSVFLVQDSFFQYPDIVNKFTGSISIQDSLELKARAWLDQHIERLKATSTVFVHIRRGDYIRWPSEDNPAVLTLQWYIEALSLFRRRLERPLFVVTTDDVPYASEFLGHIPDVVISRHSELADFAIMTLCSNGILSPSSFSWWAANLARNRMNGSGLFVAPLFWAGHRTGYWYPEDFITQWIEYV